jgi:hypothetical protein
MNCAGVHLTNFHSSMILHAFPWLSSKHFGPLTRYHSMEDTSISDVPAFQYLEHAFYREERSASKTKFHYKVVISHDYQNSTIATDWFSQEKGRLDL